MCLSMLHSSSLSPALPFQCFHINGRQLSLTKTPFLPSSQSLASLRDLQIRAADGGKKRTVRVASSSLLESPVLWAGRLCVFYALLKAGLAGSASNPFISSGLDDGDDMGFSKWLEGLQGISSDEKDAIDRRKLVSKWHPTTKGTLKRSYRVPSKAEGRRLLQNIASLLSEDDHFIDATSHKGEHNGSRWSQRCPLRQRWGPRDGGGATSPKGCATSSLWPMTEMKAGGTATDGDALVEPVPEKEKNFNGQW